MNSILDDIICQAPAPSTAVFWSKRRAAVIVGFADDVSAAEIPQKFNYRGTKCFWHHMNGSVCIDCGSTSGSHYCPYGQVQPTKRQRSGTPLVINNNKTVNQYNSATRIEYTDTSPSPPSASAVVARRNPDRCVFLVRAEQNQP